MDLLNTNVLTSLVDLARFNMTSMIRDDFFVYSGIITSPRPNAVTRGLFSRSDNMVVISPNAMNNQSTMSHEIFHMAAFQISDTSFDDLWFVEGMADMFASRASRPTSSDFNLDKAKTALSSNQIFVNANGYDNYLFFSTLVDCLSESSTANLVENTRMTGNTITNFINTLAIVNPNCRYEKIASEFVMKEALSFLSNGIEFSEDNGVFFFPDVVNSTISVKTGLVHPLERITLTQTEYDSTQNVEVKITGASVLIYDLSNERTYANGDTVPRDEFFSSEMMSGQLVLVDANPIDQNVSMDQNVSVEIKLVEELSLEILTYHNLETITTEGGSAGNGTFTEPSDQLSSTITSNGGEFNSSFNTDEDTPPNLRPPGGQSTYEIVASDSRLSIRASASLTANDGGIALDVGFIINGLPRGDWCVVRNDTGTTGAVSGTVPDRDGIVSFEDLTFDGQLIVRAALITQGTNLSYSFELDLFRPNESGECETS